MMVHVHISYRKLEELCEADGEYVLCRDYEDVVEIQPEEVEFDNLDIEDIVGEYFDDIVKIILRKYKHVLMKRING
ncbi:hypothetical protein [Saccharolobus caldissimus]|uniref:Uncharacterized protein n=1 Tax=Saccharolobus caldissimus TaxID=1702097 RepID=A0AAQ4CQ54_9CREN|nr:hypothetical protein [Saccharolobus caldissimus]BDB97935.1 hypothetical protein SACC_09520 [Saccharolobus caldissimus]